ncbi:MAG TPA: LicD family protein [Candidatus Paceibacterota bacterium]|nr:LicD family protein [Candidatus Paceibacterota bacterium]
MNKKEKIAKKYSYTCNKDPETKCLGRKWGKVKSKYVNSKNFNFKSRTKNLLDVKDILDKMEIPFFLTHGALLGAYRDGDFIKWDDDVELDIFEEILLPNYDKLCKNLIKCGFVLRGRKRKFKKQKGEKFNIYRDKEKMSIRGIYLDPSYKNNKYRLTNVFQYLRKFHENPDTIKFKDAIFQTPGPIEEFLSYRYGKNWDIPINMYGTKGKSKKANLDSYERGVRRFLK